MTSASLADADSTVAAEPAPPAHGRLSVHGLIVVGTLAAAADWLLYGHLPGIALAVFVVLLAAGALIANPLRARLRTMALAAFILLAGLLPHIVNPGVLSLGFLIAAIALFAALLFADASLAADRLAAAREVVLGCLWRAPADVAGALVKAGIRKPQSLTGMLVVWIVPVALGLVFVRLFVEANPLIASWAQAIDIGALVDWAMKHVDGARVAFWLLAAMLVWPVIFMREYRRRTPPAALRASAPEAGGGGLFPQIVGSGAVLRSLIVFNALFAVQTVLDALYLWGGVALPDGMTFAEYAHRGAYPLIVTALLAAAFVVLALKPGSDTERTPLIRALVWAWIAQNVWLVISSMLRLDLYVAAYSLTYWRVAAFVWMLLVASGLVLILARIALGRSSGWLIGANLASLALTLYACSFANFAAIIADYNVAHSAEMGGGGPNLDREYIRSLGRHAIPAADTFVIRNRDAAPNQFSYRFPSWREEHADALRAEMQDWRAWSCWNWRLARYLEATPAPGPAH